MSVAGNFDAALHDFAACDALPRMRVGAAELRVGLPEGGSDSGPPLLFIPGAYHGAWCYAGWLELARRAGIACAALDYRGHGALGAEGLDPATAVGDYAADTVVAARTFRRAPIVVGHSLGGLVAMAAAQSFRCAGLALIAPSPPGNLAGARALPPIVADRLKAPPAPAEVLERFLGGFDGGLLAACLARLTPESPAALNERYLLSVMVDTARIHCPTLVVEAGLDCGERHPAGQDEAIARFFKGEFAHLAGAPHCMMLGPTCEPAFRLVAGWRARRFGGT